jgi:hypothetical protein
MNDTLREIHFPIAEVTYFLRLMTIYVKCCNFATQESNLNIFYQRSKPHDADQDETKFRSSNQSKQTIIRNKSNYLANILNLSKE